MRIISWNCNRSFRTKLALMEPLKPDLLIIQESEDPTLYPSAFDNYTYLWEKSDSKCGIGIFASDSSLLKRCEWSGTFTIKDISNGSPALSWSTADLHQFLPFRFNNDLTILSVWTKQANSASFQYIGQFWKYLQIHKRDLPGAKTLIVGDFNSNPVWDRSDRWWNHSDVERELSSLGFQSLYHSETKEKAGRESTPTLYHRKEHDKPYHVDYAYLSGDLIPRAKICVGKREDWIEFSDHMPLIIDLDEKS